MAAGLELLWASSKYIVNLNTYQRKATEFQEQQKNFKYMIQLKHRKTVCNITKASELTEPKQHDLQDWLLSAYLAKWVNNH